MAGDDDRVRFTVTAYPRVVRWDDPDHPRHKRRAQHGAVYAERTASGDVTFGHVKIGHVCEDAGETVVARADLDDLIACLQEVAAARE